MQPLRRPRKRHEKERPREIQLGCGSQRRQQQQKQQQRAWRSLLPRKYGFWRGTCFPFADFFHRWEKKTNSLQFLAPGHVFCSSSRCRCCISCMYMSSGMFFRYFQLLPTSFHACMFEGLFSRLADIICRCASHPKAFFVCWFPAFAIFSTHFLAGCVLCRPPLPCKIRVHMCARECICGFTRMPGRSDNPLSFLLQKKGSARKNNRDSDYEDESPSGKVIFIFACVRVCVHAYIHIFFCAVLYPCFSIHIPLHIHVCVCVYACIFTCSMIVSAPSACAHAYVYACSACTNQRCSHMSLA